MISIIMLGDGHIHLSLIYHTRHYILTIVGHTLHSVSMFDICSLQSTVPDLAIRPEDTD